MAKRIADESKENLENIRKENNEYILKIEELIQEKIQLANELSQVTQPNVKYLNEEEDKEGIIILIIEYYQEEVSKQDVEMNSNYNNRSIQENDENDINEKLQGILTKCKDCNKIIDRKFVPSESQDKDEKLDLSMTQRVTKAKMRIEVLKQEKKNLQDKLFNSN